MNALFNFGRVFAHLRDGLRLSNVSDNFAHEHFAEDFENLLDVEIDFLFNTNFLMRGLACM